MDQAIVSQIKPKYDDRLLVDLWGFTSFFTCSEKKLFCTSTKSKQTQFCAHVLVNRQKYPNNVKVKLQFGLMGIKLYREETKYEFIKTLASLWNASVAVHKRQKQPAENCDHSNHFFLLSDQPTLSLKNIRLRFRSFYCPRMLVIHQE